MSIICTHNCKFADIYVCVDIHSKWNVYVCVFTQVWRKGNKSEGNLTIYEN